ncbi:helix-turn-helix transcriptional regulator [Dactylosporangium sp. CS-033363]|uniref:helix-turn-helix transcriptional regulator n=1 Tax=Dactylosporangium sp. CS-033363 TaxID=3239935 RepID=UPI003D919859
MPVLTAEGFELFGREGAFRVIAAACAQGGQVVVSGEPGMGKSSLLRVGGQLAQRAGRRVLAIAPTEFDQGLPFAGLAELVAQCPPDGPDRLPAPQRRALAIALQQVEPEGGTIDPLAVPLAIRSLLTNLAGTEPVTVVLDDVQWLDPATAGALAFALRRLALPGDRLSVLAGTRPAGLRTDLVRTLPEPRRDVDLPALDEHAIAQLLRRRFGSTWTQSVSSAVARASGGNPFLALMIAQAMRSDVSQWSWSARDGHDPVFPVPPSLTDVLGEKVALLPAAAREVLLLVSAAGRLNVHQLDKFAGPDHVVAALEAAADADLARVGPEQRVAFTHPLLASAIYEAATPAERRRAHRRLADSLDDQVERAVHRARTVTAPDLAVAGELERAADVSARRGALQVAGELLEASARATPAAGAPTGPFPRWLRVVDTYTLAGDTDAARAALGVLDPLASSPQERAEAILRRIDLTRRMPGARALAEQALALAPPGTEVRNALTTLLGALHRLEGNGPEALRLTRAAVAEARAGNRDAALLRALYGRLTVERHWASGDAGRTLGEIDRLAAAATDLPGPFLAWSHAFFAPWDDPTAEEPVRREIRAALEAGRYGDLTQLYIALVLHLTRASRIQAARAALEEADRAGAWSLSAFQEQIARGLVAAYTGELDLARAVVGPAAEEARAIESTYWLCSFLTIRGFVETSAGDWPAALQVYREVAAVFERTGMVDLEQILWGVDYADAALQTGAFDEVERAVAVLRRQGAAGLPEAVVAADRCEALRRAATGDVDTALHDLRRITALDGAESPFEATRSRLALGQVYRRAGHKRGSADTLTAAADSFASLGYPRWADRARAELARSGLHQSGEALTENERRVAELAAAGRSNQEVAAALFMSVKTVEAHLTRVYRKLSVRSRTELARRLEP